MVQLTDRALTAEESSTVSELLHTLSDYERIGDYIVNVAECAQSMHARGMTFSDNATEELDVFMAAVGDILEKATRGYQNRDREESYTVEPLEEVIDLMRDELRNRHIERLKSNECTIELGTQFLELLINLERVADHCSNVALYIIRQTAPQGDLSRIDSHHPLQTETPYIAVVKRCCARGFLFNNL